MRKLIGVICVILGTVCILSSVGFVVYNRIESEDAKNTSVSLLKEVKGVIAKKSDEQKNVGTKMATVKVDGYDCIGFLSIPVLNLELPVLTDWSYEKLKKAPCHYYGSCYEKDLVIAAHNYKSHFGRLSELKAGDIVVFTDVSGAVHCYEAVVVETLPKNATKEMITSGFDLSLYTCTPGGNNRATVRCRVVESN